MMLDFEAFYEMSKNPVQKEFIRKLFHFVEDNTDDVYDYANWVAALKKFTHKLDEDYSEMMLRFHGIKFQDYVESAMGDWKDKSKIEDENKP